MDFSWSGLSTPDAGFGLEFPILDLMVFEVLNLGAALYLLENSSTPEKFAVNRSMKYNSELAYTSAAAIVDEIQTVGRKVLKMLDTRSSSNLVRYSVVPDHISTFTQQFPGDDDLGVIGARLRSSFEKSHMLDIF
jgi:hypothetical protein